MNDVFVFVRGNGKRCLIGRDMSRRLKRNGWITGPIHIFPVVSGLALSGEHGRVLRLAGLLHFSRLRSRISREVIISAISNG